MTTATVIRPMAAVAAVLPEDTVPPQDSVLPGSTMLPGYAVLPGRTVPKPPQQARKHYARRAVVVPASLADLHGPVDGLIELPQRLFWSAAEHMFDLSVADRLLEMYEAVFDAARTEADLTEYLNRETLARVWPELALPPRIRRAWETAHPQLSRAELATTAPAVPAA